MEELQMSPVPVGQFQMEAGELILRVTNPTVKELEEKPEHAIGVLLIVIWQRCFDITRSADGAESSNEWLNILWNWIYCEPPLSRKAALELALQQDNLWDMENALIRTQKRGRPIKSRHTAIKALFRKAYLNKSWAEVTRRLCPCGRSHDDSLTLKSCQDNIESAVRHLKRMLKKYDIAFPPPRPKESQSRYRGSESAQSEPHNLQKIPTLEESSGSLRVPDSYETQHPAIAILLDGGPLPAIPLSNDSEHGDESDAWNLFNPWVPGWVPLWFPDIRTEPIGTRKELQQRRLDWFNRVFEHFAGPDWQRKGSLDSRRELIALILLRMYRDERDEKTPTLDELDKLKATMS
jgi:hypothetical protein